MDAVLRAGAREAYTIEAHGCRYHAGLPVDEPTGNMIATSAVDKRSGCDPWKGLCIGLSG